MGMHVGQSSTAQIRYGTSKVTVAYSYRWVRDVGSLLYEALPAGNSPKINAAADENVQDIETLNIFQDQTSTPPEGSVESPKATDHAESSSTTVETGDMEHKPDGSVTIKQDDALQKSRR
ncbi:hypothetical protein T07_7999 [Trichinella nelsoni]|uniref:Uncharacterized protein n=1 Tax=Trichinella nelsoni TaxID=6336 RepID=A0A0V0SMM3_9BILA|nr:hypothetical protein T07_7999 [Trichinella nelsoni]